MRRRRRWRRRRTAAVIARVAHARHEAALLARGCGHPIRVAVALIGEAPRPRTVAPVAHHVRRRRGGAHRARRRRWGCWRQIRRGQPWRRIRRGQPWRQSRRCRRQRVAAVVARVSGTSREARELANRNARPVCVAVALVGVPPRPRTVSPVAHHGRRRRVGARGARHGCTSRGGGRDRPKPACCAVFAFFSIYTHVCAMNRVPSAGRATLPISFHMSRS